MATGDYKKGSRAYRKKLGELDFEAPLSRPSRYILFFHLGQGFIFPISMESSQVAEYRRIVAGLEGHLSTLHGQSDPKATSMVKRQIELLSRYIPDKAHDEQPSSQENARFVQSLIGNYTASTAYYARLYKS